MIGDTNDSLPSEGTLRDDFAMAALTGLLANPKDKDGVSLADMAYALADLMLEARKPPGPPDPLGRDKEGVSAKFRAWREAAQKSAVAPSAA